MWADGADVNFTFWGRGEPRNDNDKDCVVTSGTDRCYRWKEIACDSCKAYTCKKGEQAQTTEIPSFFILFV